MIRTIADIRLCNHIPVSVIDELCRCVIDILIEEANVLLLQAPVTICGDIHGQFHDLLQLFHIGGALPELQYLFLGDFVDRGYYSLELFLLLVAYKVKYPQRIHMIRGNHESRQITMVYGFYDECLRKYGDAEVWKMCCEVFDYLSIGAVVEGQYSSSVGSKVSTSVSSPPSPAPICTAFTSTSTSTSSSSTSTFPSFSPSAISSPETPHTPTTTISNIDEGVDFAKNGAVFCIHGGLSPDVSTIDQIMLMDRKQEVPHEGGMCDLLWSDPEESITNWSISPRGAGYLFGESQVNQFLHMNNFSSIARAHQLVMEGYKEMFGGKLVTVWSAPNYCYRCGNVASVLCLDLALDKEYKVFEASNDDEDEDEADEERSRRARLVRKPAVEYFI